MAASPTSSSTLLVRCFSICKICPAYLSLVAARFCRHLSIFLCHEEIAVRYFNLIVDFFKTEYTQLLIVYNVYSIYYEDTRIPGRRHIADSDSDSDFGGKWEVVKGETHTHTDVTVVWTETIEHITLSCFDQVLAISEESINALFKSWWLSAKSSHGHRLYGWSFEHSFHISAFRQSRVQLLSGNRAVIWFNIDSGHLLLDELVLGCRYCASPLTDAPFVVTISSTTATAGASPSRLTLRWSRTGSSTILTLLSEGSRNRLSTSATDITKTVTSAILYLILRVCPYRLLFVVNI